MVLMVTAGLLISGCSIVPKGSVDLDVGIKERGIASWYGEDFHGRLTANGELYDVQAFTAAHRTLPLGTIVRVTNADNGKQVHVRINDRGPYVDGRIIDLSLASARELGMVAGGTAPVQLEVVGQESMFLVAVTRAISALRAFEFFGSDQASGDHVQGTPVHRRSVPKEACRWRGFTAGIRRGSSDLEGQPLPEQTACRTTDLQTAEPNVPFPVRHFLSISLG
jgi:rare lipoprotein A